MNFINGNKFKELDNGNDIFYCKIDNVFTFKAPDRPYKLITHNGDFGVTQQMFERLNTPNLIKWYGQNILFEHPKIQSLPIGLDRGLREDIYNSVLNEDHIRIVRSDLFYFRHWGDSMVKAYRDSVRSALMSQGLIQHEKQGITEHLMDLKSSMFCPCPNGNGVDTHSLWECIYMGCVPIVEDSINVRFYKDLPILIINDWNNLPLLSENLYKEIRKKSLEKADFNYWKQLIQK